VKFGLFYEMQLPRPAGAETWDPAAESRLYAETLDQVGLADRMGFSYVFAAEHHFLEEYSHSSAPELWLAALSQRTTNIRLGHGIALTLPAYTHPARMAERLAVLDVLSGGRVEFGSGQSSSAMELGGFGIAPDDRRDMWEEATREICNMLALTPYPGFEGRFFRMPSRNVIPKPVQQPHPPLWVAATRPQTSAVAARFGMGSLGLGFETPAAVAARVEDYWRIVVDECVPIGRAVNPGVAALISLMCAETDDEAQRRSADGPAFFSFALDHYVNPATGAQHVPGVTNLYRSFIDSSAPPAARPGPVRLARRAAAAGRSVLGRIGSRSERLAEGPQPSAGPAIGSVETVRRRIQRFEDAHIDVLIFVAQTGTRRHEHIMESIERFGREVLPEFRERHETAHRRWRSQRLSRLRFPDNSSI
jgi:alkanesulfonate monooxygenase SsuD/methylene tetrahydromethanopterin reductase-like flavin-dependent oxidoreductase (luciferase family)